jgi:hypothetical protein
VAASASAKVVAQATPSINTDPTSAAVYRDRSPLDPSAEEMAAIVGHCQTDEVTMMPAG